jgi:hypothetical protein
LALLRDIQHRFELAEVLTLLGRLCQKLRRADEAQELLEEAVNVSREIHRPDTEALAAASLAQMSGADTSHAEAVFEAHRTHVGAFELLPVCWALWQATWKLQYLDTAHAQLQSLRDHAPPECRDAMIENVPLHRDIVEAWNAQGEAGEFL